MKVLAHLPFWGPGSDNVGLALEGTLSSGMSVGTLGGGYIISFSPFHWLCSWIL